ncbi:HDOD domain-containing protein [Litoribacillus peritrichatus]|uniref:HDOD domain-containing protein n=1 Tax=Litoribacillus peritrichatus TaxID=718191 RepID=A0ABP7MRJ4_9GAMM
MQINENVIEHVIQGFHIPPKPAVLEEIQLLAKSQNADPSEIACCVASDVGLSAAILKTLNSPFYGMARSISDVKQATVMLGINSVMNLVAAYEIRKSMDGKACISFERFWDHSANIANAMVFIGKRVNPTIPLEDLHIAGLFHDCGLPAMAMKFDDYVEVLKTANERHEISLVDLEENSYRTNHTVVGYYIATSWGLPKELCNLVLRHHETSLLHKASSLDADNRLCWMFAVLKIAENISENARNGVDTRDWAFVKDDIYTFLGINEDEYKNMEEDLNEVE